MLSLLIFSYANGLFSSLRIKRTTYRDIGVRFRVMNELRHRGVEDILLAVVDGLKGFPDAIRAVFPEALVQTCIVHLLRHSLDFVAWKDRKSIATALKDIYLALDSEAAKAALAAFAESPWGRKYAAIVQSWERA